MSKKQVEEAQVVEETKESSVTVEMTADQREDFVQFMKDKEAAKKAQEELDEETEKGKKIVHVRLSARHSINGESYGPGVVPIPYSLLGTLQHQEAQWRDHELAIFAPSKTILKRILEGGQVVEVGSNKLPRTVQREFGL